MAARLFNQLAVVQNERNLFNGGGGAGGIYKWLRTGNPYRRGRLSMVDLFVKITCFIKEKKYIFITKRI